MSDEPTTPTVSVAVVNYNTAALLERCLESVRRFVRPLGAEVIVVDNASRDGSVEMVGRRFPWARLVENPVNRYFTGGVNQAARLARGEFLLLINSDTCFIDDSVGELVEFMRAHPECGAAEGLTLDADNRRPSLTARRFCTIAGELARFSFWGRFVRSGRYYARMHYADADQTATWPVEVACNCYMIVRTEAFRKMGLADEAMLLYYSEDDWARRLAGMGLREYHVGSARIVHRWRASSDLLPPVRYEAIFCHDRFAYLRKHHGPAAAWLTTLLILLRPNLLRSLRVLRQWRRLPARVPPLPGGEPQ